MVDAPDLAGIPHQQMVGLAVGAVRDQVEAGDNSELVGTLVFQGVVILLGVVLDELLHRADAMRPVPNDGEGDDVPAEESRSTDRPRTPFYRACRWENPKAGLRLFSVYRWPGFRCRPTLS